MKIGPVNYFFKYLFNKKFRQAVELEAYTEIDQKVFGCWSDPDKLKEYIKRMY